MAAPAKSPATTARKGAGPTWSLRTATQLSTMRSPLAMKVSHGEDPHRGGDEPRRHDGDGQQHHGHGIGQDRSEGDGRHDGTHVRLEEIGAHARDVAHVVAYVVGDHRWVAR